MNGSTRVACDTSFIFSISFSAEGKYIHSYDTIIQCKWSVLTTGNSLSIDFKLFALMKIHSKSSKSRRAPFSELSLLIARWTCFNALGTASLSIFDIWLSATSKCSTSCISYEKKNTIRIGKLTIFFKDKFEAIFRYRNERSEPIPNPKL